MSNEKKMSKLYIPNARCSFPSLFEEREIDGKKSGYGARLLLEENGDSVKKVRMYMQALADESPVLKGRLGVLTEDCICLRSPKILKNPEYEGYKILNANSRRPVIVVDSTGRGLITSPHECLIYSGCYVNASVSFWFQDNKFGQKINCTLISIQFSKHGDSFGGRVITKEEAVEGFAPISSGLLEDDTPF